MSEHSNVSASGGPRANPLYGGPSTSASGNRTPSWTRKTGGTTGRPSYSDASSPPDSPARSARSNNGPAPYYAPQYEHPGYMVETPSANHSQHQQQHHEAMVGQSPFRAPPYYVQTPAHSERPGSPMSSVPDSPAHLAQGMSYDMRSVRSGKYGAGVSRVASGGFVGSGPGGLAGGPRNPVPLSARINEEGDEEDLLYDAPAGKVGGEEARKRSKRFWRICMALTLVVLVLAAVAAGISLYYVFQPDPPSYSFDFATLNEFQIVNKLADGTGLPTDQLFANITLSFSVNNPNGKYVVYGDGGLVQIGYSSIPTLMQGGLPYFGLTKKNWTSFDTSLGVSMYPLYGVGPGLRDDIMGEYVAVNVRAQLRSHVEMAWKVVQTKYTHLMDCTVSFNPVNLQYLNDTCIIKKK
eukprot:TRINITY_DN3164_c0_g1_i2.p1 TRINITY_DN3164_c0_g1~~TRINITY_DN3164_c0_g1_i2.p1  ORF type:complete len:409 (-),score=-7.63 TRINITY_DN3164_c0_g1_i2:412-1638(-)